MWLLILAFGGRKTEICIMWYPVFLTFLYETITSDLTCNDLGAENVKREHPTNVASNSPAPSTHSYTGNNLIRPK